MELVKFEFTTDDAKMLWLCIQRAPLPREATDPLAAAFIKQLEAHNMMMMERAKFKVNGSSHAAQS